MSSRQGPNRVAAIVLGGGLTKVQIQDQVRYEPEEQAKERLDRAYALLIEGEVDCIITTGKVSIMASVDPDVSGPKTEAEVGKAYLLARANADRSGGGVSAVRRLQDRIFFENQSFDTISNAWFAKKDCLEPLGITSCIVVTSDYHIARSKVIFEWVLGPAYVVRCAASPSRLDDREREKRDRFEQRITEQIKTHLVSRIAAGDDEALARFMEDEHKKLFSGKPPFPRERDGELPPLPGDRVHCG